MIMGAHGVHELFLMCGDVKAFVADMQERSIACSAVKDARPKM
jgi:hypothetical protein